MIEPPSTFVSRLAMVVTITASLTVSCGVTTAPGAAPPSLSSGGGSGGDPAPDGELGDPPLDAAETTTTRPGELDDASAAPGCTGGVTQSCPHSLCGPGAALDVGCDNAPAPAAPLDCVSRVCAALPGCCSSAWDAACVAAVPGLCNVGCGSSHGACAVCFEDTLDHDGDGYAWTQGDCADCDPSINPGAHDYPGNGVDEDCSGAADDEPFACDSSLALASGAALDFASAIDLCKTTTASAVGVERTWGVISAALVQADGSQAPSERSHGILAAYGPNTAPRRGKSMAAFSTGTARAAGDPGWINPDRQYGSFDQGKESAYPPGSPGSSAGLAHDSTGLLLRVRVPTNARSFSYRFKLFSADYPEPGGTAFDDRYLALLRTGYLQAVGATRPVAISSLGVDSSLFTVTGGPGLAGTGLDGVCGGQACGASTEWLRTSAPVVPGETITIQFSIWDTGDHLGDSTVLVDDWAWSDSQSPLVTR